jgi:ABC-type branched-subunit amino acid transport system ATPase component
VRDNLLTAADRRDAAAYLTDLVIPGVPRLPPALLGAVADFGLVGDLDRKPSELPYGRRRLVAIARAVAARPSVILLDEPAAGLDESETTELITLLELLANEWGMGVLLIEHHIELVMRVCDRVYALSQGSFIASGTPAEVRRHPAVIGAYLGAEHDDAPIDRKEPVGNPDRL